MNHAISSLSWRWLRRLLGAVMLAMTVMAVPANAQLERPTAAPDELISQISSTILEAVRADPGLRGGDLVKLTALVDAQVMPHVDFERMTASAVGLNWRRATPAQRNRLRDEFKSLLLRVYSGTLAQVTDQTTIEVKRLRAPAVARDVTVRTVVRGGRSDPVQLNYRLTLEDGAWKIYDINVSGVWLVLNYRSSFAQEIATNGIEGLIARLVTLREGR